MTPPPALRLSAWDEARQLLEDRLLGLLAERGRESGVGIRAAETLDSDLGQTCTGTLADTLAEELNLAPGNSNGCSRRKSA